MSWDWTGKRVLVTGAGSGLGAAMARDLGARGARLWLVDVDPNGLAKTHADTGGESAVVDVTDAEAMGALADAVHREGPLDVLVNNAGVVAAGPLLKMSLDDLNWMLDVNVRGVVHGCHHFGPAMADAPGRRQIVNIASAAGFMGFPWAGAYCMTKCAVLGWSEALAAEHDPASLGVTVVCPGFTRTHLADAGRFSGGNPAALERLTNRLFAIPWRRPETVARRMAKAVEQNRFLVPVFAEAQASWIGRRLPVKVANRLRRAIGRRVKAD